MRRSALLALLAAAAMIVSSCGGEEQEPQQQETSEASIEEVETVAEELESTDIVEEFTASATEEVVAERADETAEVETEEVTGETAQEPEIGTVPLPEPWPADFPIPDCFEIVSNTRDGNGCPVLVAIVPEGVERPGIWDLGYFFRDEIEGWSVVEEDNWNCMLSAFNFNVPLTQDNKHIYVHGWFDSDNVMTIDLLYSEDVQ